MSKAKINGTEGRKTTEKMKKTKSLFSEKVNKIDVFSYTDFKKKREKNQIIKIRNKRGDITIILTEIKSIVTEYYEQL